VHEDLTVSIRIPKLYLLYFIVFEQLLRAIKMTNYCNTDCFRRNFMQTIESAASE